MMLKPGEKETKFLPDCVEDDVPITVCQLVHQSNNILSYFTL